MNRNVIVFTPDKYIFYVSGHICIINTNKDEVSSCLTYLFKYTMSNKLKQQVLNTFQLTIFNRWTSKQSEYMAIIIFKQ